MCCSFWEKCIKSKKNGLGCSTPLNRFLWFFLDSWSLYVVFSSVLSSLCCHGNLHSLSFYCKQQHYMGLQLSTWYLLPRWVTFYYKQQHYMGLQLLTWCLLPRWVSFYYKHQHYMGLQLLTWCLLPRWVSFYYKHQHYMALQLSTWYLLPRWVTIFGENWGRLIGAEVWQGTYSFVLIFCENVEAL